MKDFKNNDYCKKCKGTCCKRMGCHLSPEDINGDITYDKLKRLLDTGNYSIDWWEGEESLYYIRMRNKNANIIDPSWGGECVLLTENGCSLNFENRSKGGRMLLARINEFEKCKDYYSKEDCVHDWQQYSNILKKLFDEFNS